MDDKTFELLEKIYSDFSSRFDKVEARLDNVDARLGNVEGSVRTIGNKVTSLEFDLKKDISALYDGYKQTYEKLETIEKKVDTLKVGGLI
jgi:tetrahydromethanopterin S-methyltransferase subunit G